MDYEEMSDAELWALTSDEDQRLRADALANLTHRFFHREKYTDVIGPGEAAIEVHHELNDTLGEGRMNYFVGYSEWMLDRFDDALKHLSNSTEIYRIHASEIMLADSIRAQANCYKALEKYDEAAESWRSAIGLYSSNDRLTLAGICALDLGEMQGQNGNQSEALTLFQESLTLFQSCGDLIGSGRANDRMAAALIDLGHIDKALVCLQEALNIFDYIKDESRLAWAQYRLGWTHVTNGDFYEAIPYLRQASAWYKGKSMFISAANADSQLAHALVEVGGEEEAIDLYRKTRSVYQGAGEVQNAFIADVNTAGRIRFSEPAEAMNLYRRAIQGGKDLDDDWLVRASTVRLAECLQESEVMASKEEALALLAEVKVEDWGDNKYEQARHLNILAKLHLDLNDVERAVPLLETIIGFGQESGFLGESAQAYELLAIVARDRGEEAQSNELVSRAIALYLAAGSDEKARRLSTRFLPSTNSSQAGRLQTELEMPPSNEDNH